MLCVSLLQHFFEAERHQVKIKKQLKFLLFLETLSLFIIKRSGFEQRLAAQHAPMEPPLHILPE